MCNHSLLLISVYTIAEDTGKFNGTRFDILEKQKTALVGAVLIIRW